MCKVLNEREKKSLEKGKLLLEQLTGKKVILESRKDCTCCKDKNVIKESNDYSKQKEYIGYEILCRDSEGSLKELIEYIKLIGNTGHSFEIIVDPESEGEKKFFWDGDGADMISEIKPIENKQNLTESLDQSYSDMEDLAEAIITDLAKGCSIQEDAAIRNIILSNISSDIISNEKKVKDVLKVLKGQGEAQLRRLFKFYNAVLQENKQNLQEDVVSTDTLNKVIEKLTELDAGDKCIDYVKNNPKTIEYINATFNKGFSIDHIAGSIRDKWYGV